MKDQLSIAWKLALAVALGLAASHGMAAETILAGSSLDALDALDRQAARIDALEAELAAMRRHTSHVQVSAGGSCAKVCCPTKCCKQGGFVGGVEVAVLKAHTGELGVSLNGSPTLTLTPGIDYEPSLRFWGGYESADGLGIRARYWNYDHANSGGDLANFLDVDVVEGVDAQTVDVEIYQQTQFRKWEFEFAGGVRWARLEEELRVRDAGFDLFGFGNHAEGVGPTVALNFRRPVGNRGLALVGGCRASLLFGDSDFFLQEDLIGFLNPLVLDAASEHMEIYEVRLGAEYSRNIGAGGRIFGQAVLEAQTWEVNGLLGTDVGFVGPSFSIGLER